MSITNKDGNTILHLASALDNAGLVAALSQQLREDVNARNNFGQTPLHIAYKHGKLENVLLLIQNGANISVKDFDGKIPSDLDESVT
jgi:ankyrin repeat protein